MLVRRCELRDEPEALSSAVAWPPAQDDGVSSLDTVAWLLHKDGVTLDTAAWPCTRMTFKI